LSNEIEGAGVSDAELERAASARSNARAQASRDRTVAARSSAQAEIEKRVRAKLAEDADFDTMAEFQSQKAEDHFVINIPSTGKEDEVKRVEVIPNGVFYSIQRDEDVLVPKIVCHALDIAVETRYRDKKDKEGRPIKVPFKVRSYPYVVISGPHDSPGISEPTVLDGSDE
jgi:hypothetical protein